MLHAQGARSRHPDALPVWSDLNHEGLTSLQKRRRRIEAHKIIFHERDRPEDAYLLRSGWACTYRMLQNGDRQVLSFPIAGDIVGLSNCGGSASAFTFESVTEIEVAAFSLKSLGELIASSPVVADFLLGSLCRNNAIFGERIIDIGRRSALVRTAHLILELSFRLEMIGVPAREQFSIPINQSLIADAIGLTAIHLNRILRQLREAELVTVRAGRITIHDYNGLVELAAFDPSYLAPTSA